MGKRLYEEKRAGQIYVFEIENYWCKIKKGSRQNRKYLGKKDPITGKIIKKKTTNGHHQTTGCHDFGDLIFLDLLSKKIGLYECLRNNFEQDYKKILALSFYKILQSGPYYLYPFWFEENFLSKGVRFSAKNISVFLSSIGKDQSTVEYFFKNWISHNEAEGVVMFDITSLSSYGEKNSFLERGYNRDGELLDQINLGVLSKKTDSSGHLPMAYKIYPGSINDVVTIENLSKFIKSYDLSAEVFIMDKGFYSQKNLDVMSRQELFFMLPMSFSTKKSMEIIEKVFKSIHSCESVFEFNDEIYSYVRTSKKIGKHDYMVHVFLDKKLRLSQESVFFKKLIEVEEKFKKMGFRTKQEAEVFFEESLKSKRKFFNLSDKLELERNNQEIENEMRRFGFMIILTNKTELNSKKILILYRSKDKIEKVFNNLKNDINEKRNRVHSLESVRGAMFINFISLILISKIDSVMREKKLYKKLSKIEIYKTLNKLKVYQTASGEDVLGEFSKIQKAIFSAFQISYPDKPGRILV